MRLHTRPFFILLFIFCFNPLGTLWAESTLGPKMGQDIADLKRMMTAMESNMEVLKSTVRAQNEIIERQNYRIEVFEKKQTAVSVQTAMPQTPLQVNPKANAGWNPDIGIAGTVQTKLTQNKSDTEGNNAIALKEFEMTLGQVVDPYSRFDATISLNDHIEEHVIHLEEAYYTRWGLPLGFTGQIGKFRANIGKANLMHAHALPTADYPLVIQNFFGEEGLSSSGLRLRNDIPNPWDLPLEVTGEILRGNNGASFAEVSRRPIFNTHLKTFFEPSADTNLELGWTTMFGTVNPPLTIDAGDGTTTEWTRPEGTDWYGVKVYGGDATFHWFLPEGKQVTWQNEIYFQNRPDLVNSVNTKPWGFYSLVEYKLSQRFCPGVRFDYVDPLDVSGGHGTTSVSPYLIFWQSEYVDVKLQYSHTVYAGGEKTDNAAFFVVDFLAGNHKHAIQ
ncbi:MAG: hypothetical protein V1882_05135 [Candidatus Omnitrophota bacterium]